MPKSIKRALALFAALALLPISLYGCTGDTETNSVTVGIAQDILSLDPHMANTAGTREVMFNMFEGLVKASPEGGVTCAVASGYTVSADGLTYTFTLREGVTFHNGEPVTAEDAVYSLKRAAGSENDGTPLISAFSAVDTIGVDEEGHVVLTLTAPQLEFINSVASASIIPDGSGDTITENPIGTGPFRFVSRKPKDYLIMERYDGYWGEKAHLDQVTFSIIEDMSNMIMGLQGGTLDLVIHLTSSYLPTLQGDFTVLNDTMKLVQALYINNSVEPFNDARVRQALYYAIDVDEINTFVCDGTGVATGTSMYPAQQQYFMPELAKNYPHDAEKARELLAQAGYPDGFSFTITVPSNYSPHVQTAEVMAEQLKAVGVTAVVNLVEWDTWLSDVYTNRDFETSVCGVSATDMTAREMLERYTSDHRKNFINFSDEEFDRVVAQAKATLDSREQIALYKRAEEILNEKAASLWTMDLGELVVMDPALDGFTFYCTYVLDMSTIYYK